MPYALCESLREAEVYRTAFEKEKEITDRALKLAKVCKPKSSWELQGVFGLVADRIRRQEKNPTILSGFNNSNLGKPLVRPVRLEKL
jgi:hypothetical protein